MPNVIKSATTVSNGTIKRNNFLLGVDTSLPYGPTDNGVVIPAVDVTATRTFFWNGITPPPGGYAIYVQKASGGPSIYSISGDSGLITAAIQNGGTNINTVTDALNFFNDQSNYLVTNIEYPSIVATGLTLMVDAGFVPSYPRTGTTWSDLSGNNNNGTLVTSPTFTTTNEGIFLFNGSSQYVTLATPSLYTGSQFSITYWSKLTNPSTPPASTTFEGTDSSNNRVVNIHSPWNDNIVYWDCGNTTTTYDRINSSALTLAQKTGWHHYGFTKNATTGVMNIYLDGSLLTTGTAKTKTLTTCTNVNIARNTSGVNYYAGNIGNFQTYNRELSATEILQNYNAMLSRYSLLLYWDIANPNSYPGTGTTVTDLSGNGNTGTITGGVTYNTNNGGVLTTNGTTGYISSTTPNLASTNYTVIGAARYNGATRQRMINATTNNWLLGHWGSAGTPGVANYYAEGWVTSAASSQGGSDTNWRIYAGTGNIAGDSYAFYINNSLNISNNGGSAGPNGITIGRYAAGNSEYSTGDFSFLLVFNTVLSATEISSITNSFRGRFGI